MLKLKRLMLLILMLAAMPIAAQTVGPDSQFQHLPLQYRGPDPTSGYFLPASTPIEPEPSTFTQLPPPSEVVPELLNQSGSGAEPISPGWPSEASLAEPGLYGGAPGMYGTQPLHYDEPISDFKDGFFQKLAFTGTYIDRGSLASFGLNELDLSLTVAVPAPTRQWPMLITPAFNVIYVDGPTTPDLPARLYETYVDFLWVPRLSSRWTAILGVAPSVYSDFDVDDDDAFRLTGKGLIRYDWTPERLQIIAGVLYLNRDDVRLLPAGGIIWLPAPDKKYELLFPRPKLAHRISCGPGYSDWLYVGGEFGGNTWAIRRAGVVDKVTLRDFRILFGLERKRNGGAGRIIEVGYVFSRTAEFSSGIPDVNADDTALVRGGVTF